MSPPNGLPPYVYRGRSAYEYKPYLGKGVLRPTIRLAPLDAPVSEVWAAWEERQERPNAKRTLRWLLTAYRDSPQFEATGGRPKSRSTTRDQRRMIETLCTYKVAKGRLFVELPLKSITRGVIRKFLDWRAGTAPVAANREKALISKAWNWARERDLISLENPCSGVVRNAERARDRYVTDEEYARARELAADGPWYLEPAMELAYLCRMRASEVLGLTWAQVTDDALLVRRLKGSRDGLTKWSQRLRTAVAACEERGGRGIGDAPLLRLARGTVRSRISYGTFSSAWQRHMKRCEAAGIERFTFHDLKAKGTTDFEGDAGAKQDAGGWKDPKMVDRYDRKPRTVDPTR